MKIIKSFEEKSFSNRYYLSMIDETGNTPEDFHFYWGLGNDGNLYIKCSDFQDEGWYSMTSCSFIPSLKEMSNIVKEFEHLLVFL